MQHSRYSETTTQFIDSKYIYIHKVIISRSLLHKHTDVSAGFSLRNLSALSFLFCSSDLILFTRPTSAVYLLLIFSLEAGEGGIVGFVSERVMFIVVSPLVVSPLILRRFLCMRVRQVRTFSRDQACSCLLKIINNNNKKNNNAGRCCAQKKPTL